jgi:TIR domain
MAYNVFISYASKNLHIVDWARAVLAKPGMTEIFAAEYSVIPSQVLNDEIKAALRKCDLFLLLYTHDADASKYVQQEIGFAVSSNKTVLPVVMEPDLPVPGFISELKYLPAHKNWEGSFEWLKQFVHAEATRQNNKEKLGALLAIFLGGLWLFGQGDN